MLDMFMATPYCHGAWSNNSANALTAPEIARWTAIQTAMRSSTAPLAYATAVADVDQRAEVAIVKIMARLTRASGLR